MDTSLFVNVIGFGLFGLVLYAFAEKFLPVIPSSAFIIFVGIAAGGQPAGIGLSLLALTLGSTLGAAALFLVGRHIDERRIRSFALRFGHYMLLPVERYDGLLAAYRHRHFQVSLLSQVVPIARNYTALSAGAVGVAFLPFLAATILGAFVWNTSFLTLGYFLGVSG